MRNYRVILTAQDAQKCPIYQRGDQIVADLPSVDMNSTDKMCAFLLAKLLQNRIQAEKQELCELESKFKSVDEYCKEFQIEISIYNRKGEITCPYGCKFSLIVKDKKSMSFEKDSTLSSAGDKRQAVTKLRTISILSDIHSEDILNIIDKIEIQKYPPGKIIIQKGQRGHHFYIIDKGEVEILQIMDGKKENVINKLKQGDCFGEMSLLTGNPVSATIRTSKPSTILMIKQGDFQNLLSKNPNMGLKFIQLLSQRIRTTNQRMSLVVFSGMVGELETLHLPELIQALCATHDTGILHLTYRNLQGKIYIENGEIIEVCTQNKSGEEVFYEMLRWNEGKFRFEQKQSIDQERTIFSDAMSLLLEGMRRLDESLI